MAIFIIMAAVAIIMRGFHFIDLQVVIAIVAVSLFIDMIFCKWLEYYAYVVTDQTKAFYSLIFCIIGYPAIGITFLKFIPQTWGRITLYIVIWTTALTLLEILFAKPYGVVLYAKWHIIPLSPTFYVLLFAWLYGYYKILRSRMHTI